jgi:3-(3-hydroxy-phenyl)propionate hydroxylase
MSATPPTSCDVAIIGYGPVGATLANLLGLTGVTVIVVERESIAYHLPRAVSFDDEVMRVFQTIGLAERILPDTHAVIGTRFIDAEGRLLIEWPRHSADQPMGWQGNYRFHQPTLENHLREGVTRFDNVAVRSLTEARTIAEDSDHATIGLIDLATGRADEIRARYVVGCDGARSLVRRCIGAEMQDLGLHERWLVIDAILTRDKPELGDWTLQHCNPARPATYVRGVGRRRRWEIMQTHADDPETFAAADNVWSLLRPWITPDDATIERAVPYMFHALLADRWRRGRLLLAGDSAHQTPPFLGQGMCAGIRDAANLAWKLAAVVQGRAPEALLDSYTSERAPHVREYIELAVRLGALLMAMRPGMADPLSPQTLATPRPRLGPGAFDAATPAAGHLAPQPVLSSGVRLDDAIGYRFALLLHPEAARDAILLAGDAGALRGPVARDDILVVQDAALRPWLDQVGARAALVRPDRYVQALVCRDAPTAGLAVRAG